MAVNWVTQWWRAESEIDRLRAENDELRAQVESQRRLVCDLSEAVRRMRVYQDHAQRQIDACSSIGDVFRDTQRRVEEICAPFLQEEQ